MSKQTREILDRVYLYGMNGGLGYGKFTEELSPKEAEAKLDALIQAERLKAKIDVYQRLTLWLENQDDCDKLALLGKDISVELDSLFSQLQQTNKELS